MSEAISLRGEWTISEHLGRIRTMLGIKRNSYARKPGLYSLGQPTEDSPVLVTANYKLTVDLLRRSVASRDLWILVLDTKGVNVWCAAGKGTFGTDELVHRLGETELKEKVSHRKLILPQLGAPGINPKIVKEKSGFSVLYGPVEAKDLPEYLDNGLKTTEPMRRKTFAPAERFYVGMTHLAQGLGWTLLIALLFIAGDFLLRDNPMAALNLILPMTSLLFGSVFSALLLPWLPCRAFSLKGLWISIPMALLFWALLPQTGVLHLMMNMGKILILICFTVFQCLNLTGSSTYTSLSGVKKEMLYAIPSCISVALAGVVLYIIGGVIS